MVEVRDWTIPAPGSSSARELLSESLQRLLRGLPGIEVPAELRAGHAAVLGAVREGLRVTPGAVWSALRRAPVGTWIRCARARPTAAAIVALDATLAVELAVAGVAGDVVVPAPPRVVSLGARRWFTAGPGVLRCAAGVVQHRDPQGRERVLWRGEGGEVGHVAVSDGLVLALVDDNPLAEVEAHPDKQGNAIDLGGQPVGAWVAGLQAGLALVERHLPALRAEMEVGLQQVVPVGYSETRHLSASYQEAIGTIYLSLHPQALTMAEALIHEFSHNKLYALLERGPLLENAFSPLYPSPVRPDPRPLHGVLLAVHAFLPVARLYEQVLVGGEDSPGLRRRFAEVVAGNSEAAATLRAHARPTATGAQLLAEVDRWDRHFGGEG